MSPYSFTQSFKLVNRNTDEIVGIYEKRVQSGKSDCVMYGMAGAIKDAKEWARGYGNTQKFRLSKDGAYMD